MLRCVANIDSGVKHRKAMIKTRTQSTTQRAHVTATEAESNLGVSGVLNLALIPWLDGDQTAF